MGLKHARIPSQQTTGRVCPICERRCVPLDEHMEWQPGSHSPCCQKHMVHLAIWMPCQRAVQISEAAVCWQSCQTGGAVLQVYSASASVVSPDSRTYCLSVSMERRCQRGMALWGSG
jgi:hypothetical protein